MSSSPAEAASSVADDRLRHRRNEQVAGTSKAKIDNRAPRNPQHVRQHKVLRQMAVENKMERQAKAALQESHTTAMLSMVKNYVMILCFLFVILMGAVIYVQPSFLVDKRIPLPNRDIVALYPTSVAVKKNLPRFYQNYAVVRPGNSEARDLVKAVARIRSSVVYPGTIPELNPNDPTKQLHQKTRYKQSIGLHPWEHDDFRRQLRRRKEAMGLSGDPMEMLCDSGFRPIYEDRQLWVEPSFKDDLMLLCMMRSGSHDGYIKIQRELTWNSPLTRATRGVAAQYVLVPPIAPSMAQQGEEQLDADALKTTAAGLDPQSLNSEYESESSIALKRIHSSFLILPIHSFEALGDKANRPNLTPSTELPERAFRWLIEKGPQIVREQVEGGTDKDHYKRSYEEYLYEIIHQEREKNADSWYLLNVACTVKSRDYQRSLFHRLVGTTCLSDHDIDESKTNKDNKSKSTHVRTTVEQNEGEVEEEGNRNDNDETCCSFYDPNMRPIVRQSDEDD